MATTVGYSLCMVLLLMAFWVFGSASQYASEYADIGYTVEWVLFNSGYGVPFFNLIGFSFVCFVLTFLHQKSS